jgi:formylglycine-generating enzyme required for sulfatase activity
MVRVDHYCIDRYEATLIDNRTSRALSPYYHPTLTQALNSYQTWQKQSALLGPPNARSFPVPIPDEWQLTRNPEPRAVSRPRVTPNSYLSYGIAKRACENAGKRLCAVSEWQRACRGQRNTQHPYGNAYRDGTCNVFRAVHPARELHGDPSIGHHDPRLNLVTDEGHTLLALTGETGNCRSEWPDGDVYDMVGNLDEWVDDPAGRFMGGFYARATRDGCDASITAHPPEYFDYSLGVRCCRDANTSN